MQKIGAYRAVHSFGLLSYLIILERSLTKRPVFSLHVPVDDAKTHGRDLISQRDII